MACWLSCGMMANSCNSKALHQEDGGSTYQVLADRVVQGEFESRAISSTKMETNYQSLGKTHVSPTITFKFAINGDDNEMVSGNDHQFHVLSDGRAVETPLITFGEHFVDDSEVPQGAVMAQDQQLTIRVDMNHVLKSFEEKGFFQTFNGEKIYQDDFKGLYVAGGSQPLTWDFDNLVHHTHLKLEDKEGDGVYEVKLQLNPSQDKTKTASIWELSKDISSFPQYASETVLIDALYNMSLEEMLLDIEQDGTFRTGKEWAGVWTRDISYSIVLSMAVLQPEVSQKSLMRKVKNGKIIQDTGTGGAYPVSTDRVIWAVAAWEIYLVTGDENWLREVYPIIKNSLEQDFHNVYDPEYQLVRGESSFLDWREQTYPAWMQPADIYTSLNLGTNAVHYQANQVLAEMAQVMGESQVAKKHQQVAEKIKEAMNKYFWMEEKGYFGQYLYGRNHLLLSPKSEALGEALSMIYGIADEKRAQEVVANTPVIDFGIPSIFPNIPHIPPYHNNGIWPFVQSFWTLAAAKAGNEQAVNQSLDALYRPAALFLTNKENFVAGTGDYAATQINSDRQLWSVAGNLGMVYKVFFGMDFQAGQLVFQPFVPEKYAGKKQLHNFKYRNAYLDITLEGFGNRIAAFTLDGEKLDDPIIPADLEGKHTLEIILDNQKNATQPINLVENQFAPESPQVSHKNGELINWNSVVGAVKYKVFGNGQLLETTEDTIWTGLDRGYREYQVVAVDQKGWESFASEPLNLVPESTEWKYEMENFAAKADFGSRDFSGNGYIEVSHTVNTNVQINIKVLQEGKYALDFRYANGNGPINTENKAAIRSLYKEEDFIGTVVMPQRGRAAWSNWGFTNAIHVDLEKGSHQLTLTFEQANENMNGATNQALLDYLRVIKLD